MKTMDENGEVCNINLELGLGDYKSTKGEIQRKNKRVSIFLDLSIPPHTSNDHRYGSSNVCPDNTESSYSNLKILEEDDKEGTDNFFSNGSEEDIIDHDRATNNGKNYSRKKLRLTKNQTTLLEDSFKRQTTLNTGQKLVLAEKLNLKPRQVEVWFQNRRARTKVKQTEVDCEFLKNNCERLTEENRRLKRELSELRSAARIGKPPHPVPPIARPPQPFHFRIPKETAAVKTCPSCDKIGKGRGGGKQEAAAAAADVLEVVHKYLENNQQQLGLVVGGGGEETA